MLVCRCLLWALFVHLFFFFLSPPREGAFRDCGLSRVNSFIQLTLAISTSLISNKRLSRSENLVPA